MDGSVLPYRHSLNQPVNSVRPLTHRTFQTDVNIPAPGVAEGAQNVMVVAGQAAVEGIEVDAVGIGHFGVHVQHGDLPAVRVEGAHR